MTKNMKTMKKAGLLVGLGFILFQTAQAQNLKDALKYTENHQFEEAAKIYRKLIAEKPTDGSNYYHMGENMYLSERFDSAAAYFDKGIAADPANGMNYIGKGKIALNKNDEAGAKALFDKALGMIKDGKAYMAVADAYISNQWKSMTFALECLANAEKAERNNPNVYLLLGEAALLNNNDGLTALNNFEKARDMEPKNPKPLIHIGQLYERARSYDLALEEYNKAMSLDTTFAPSYYKLGDLYYQYGKYKEAKDYMQQYVKLSKSLNAQVKYAKYLFLAKEYDAAIFEIEDIMTVDPTINILNRLLAYSQFETKDCAGAMKSIEKFMKNAETTGDKIIADDYRYYGKIVLCNTKDSLGATTAIPYLKKALEMDSMKLDVYGSLFDAYFKTKDYDNAIQTYVKKFTLVKEPMVSDIFKVGQAYYGKGILTKDSINFIKADSAFGIVTEKQPDFIFGYVFRARSNAQLDPETKLGLAKPHYESVITIGGQDVTKNKVVLYEAQYYLAYYYFVLKDKAKATEHCDLALQLNPEDKNAQALKKLIEKL